ncbi:MAG: right-handed parallel beta-helix repeat-containing protein [bacterium]|nr:right-handed parallel beta-helix repeat-containing protein [bacterium]
MAKAIAIVACALSVFLSQPAWGATWYVDAGVSTSGDGSSWQTAFKRIQEGIDAASDGDAVVVAEGTYVENIHFFGKNVVLRSTDPWDVGIVASTIIDGNEAGSVVTFSGTENGNCLLSGFTIRKGYGGSWPAAGGGICGGTRTNHTQATVENNILTDNDASEGGGIAFCDGAILNNTITANRAGGGGGLAYCDGAIVNNTISDNSATIGGGLSGCGGLIGDNVISGNFGHGGGGGLYGCPGIIQNNLITKNWTEQDESRGGGLEGCNGTIRNNVISGNKSRCHGAGGLSECNGSIENNLIIGNSSDGAGGGLSDCNGTIVNNTIVFNRGWSGGLSYCTGTIRNCIIWGNAPTNLPQLSGSSEPTYSCVQNWVGGGEGNINLNPYFVDPENGDFHLLSWSPCIDSGDPSSYFWDEPQPNGGRIDMGAYGNTPEATSKSPDTDSDGLPDDWELHWFGNLGLDAASDPDGDRILNLMDYRYGWSPKMASVTLAENVSKDLRYETIRSAICESTDGDEIIVHTGVYNENINFFGKSVILRSTDPSDPGIVAGTVIDAGISGSAVTFSGAENESCVLSGFTIRNGSGFYGGGVCGGSLDTATRATIRNCVIAGNAADQGGGIAFCDGIIRNTLIYGNTAGYGGGLAYCGGVIRNCTVADNSSSWGGGLHDCEATVVNCIIWGNIADQDPQMFHTSEPTYSCIQDWTGTGEGNITAHPYFVHAEAGDYRLRTWSPCIDAGDPSFDFSNEPEPNGGRVDMGAYGNTSQAVSKSADTDSDGLPDDWEFRWFATLDQGGDFDPDGDQIPNGEEYRYGWDPTVKAENLVENLTSGAFYQTIQDALDGSAEGDEIVVYPGLYEENIFFGDKNVVLRSILPLNADVVANTIIDGRRLAPVVVFGGTGGWTTVLSGFTIRNGKASYGGGGVSGWGTHATIRNCVITANSAGWEGGGLFRFHGTIENNLIIGNSAPDGGGLRNCEGTIRNNTIANNSAERGPGMSGCYAAIRNCIIWGNVGSESGQIAFSDPLYSCVQGWDGGGSGNIVEDPLFVDPANGNFRLLPYSPCIDSGSGEPELPETDLAGTPRIVFGGKSLTVDMGAYEHRVLSITKDASGMILTWGSIPGKTYEVQFSNDLIQWQLADTVMATAAITSWTDQDGSRIPVPLSSVSQRLYRILESP